MDCGLYQEQISRMLDGDLSAAEQDALRAHLRGCPDCRCMFETFSAVSDVLRGELEEPPAALAEGVMAAVASHEAKKLVPLKNRRRRTRGMALIAACAVVAVGLGLFASRSGFGLSRGAVADSAAAESAEAAPAEARFIEEGVAFDEAPAAAENAALEDTVLGSACADAGSAPFSNDCPVFDADGALLGVIPESLLGSFLDGVCITDGTSLPEPEAAADYRVECEGLVYEFFVRDGQLFWRSEGDGLPCLSPATEEELLSLVE